MKMVSQDEEHLRLLSILYYIWGGLTACFSCVGVAHMVFGGIMIVVGQHEHNGPPTWLGALFSFMGLLVVFIVLTLSGLSLWTGRNLQMRKHYIACLIVAGISCLSVPLGTALGVFTLVVLLRPSVKQLFAGAPLS
jgi:hypothetical protein